MAIRRQNYPLWSHAHVREQRRRARPAVVNKADGPLGHVGHAVFCVRHVKHRGLRRAVIRFDVVGRGRRYVLDLLPADACGMMRHRRFFFRHRGVLRRCSLRCFRLRSRLFRRALRALALLRRLLCRWDSHLRRWRFCRTFALAHRRRRSEQYTNSNQHARVSSHFTPLPWQSENFSGHQEFGKCTKKVPPTPRNP